MILIVVESKSAKTGFISTESFGKFLKGIIWLTELLNEIIAFEPTDNLFQKCRFQLIFQFFLVFHIYVASFSYNQSHYNYGAFLAADKTIFCHFRLPNFQVENCSSLYFNQCARWFAVGWRFSPVYYFSITFTCFSYRNGHLCCVSLRS